MPPTIRKPLRKPMTPPQEFWHVRHSCGHSAYWSDPAAAVQVAGYRCPWCGAEQGSPLPPPDALLFDATVGIVAFRDLLPGGGVPWPDGLEAPADPQITLHHMASEACCRHPWLHPPRDKLA